MQIDQSACKENRFELDILNNRLEQSFFGANIILYETVNSTNSAAKELGGTGAPEGTVVLAEEQTAGRGRMGRLWLSPGYANLLFSLLLRPKMEADQVFILTMVFALATSEAVEEISDISAMIKWPNDIYVAGKKLAGMLTEFSVKGKMVEYVVLGLGLNVNWHPADVADAGKGEKSILYPATSILKETGRRISRADLLVRILKRFESYYREVMDGSVGQFYERWNQRSVLLDKRVEIETVDGRVSGTALRIDGKGSLIILDDKGNEKRILNGDVSVGFESVANGY